VSLIVKRSRSISCYNLFTYLSITWRTVLRLFIIDVCFRTQRRGGIREKRWKKNLCLLNFQPILC